MFSLHNDWAELLKEEQNKCYYKNLITFLKEEYKKNTIYPPPEQVFDAFNITKFSKTKVVILGQDPYHGHGQAHGLSFSVQPHVSIPPSLKNIYKELQRDLDISYPNHGCLIQWAKQGVLLLNSVLTVKKGQPNSHKNMGWEQFTDKAIHLLNEKSKPVVFVLWGKNAQLKKKLVTNSNHLILESPHPSPFSARRGFFGSAPFSKVNRFLLKNNELPIDWKITERNEVEM
ncbi:uracil-DNA glycosylase [Proteinivorax tanatarense]|uniref:Uracil-DNA glycosylase n=1 Tax=Proteinivorax tanatarense TaxID=1260629 RepID=A0AAU7VLG5_9FIRM